MNRLTFPCLSAVVFPPPTGYVACFIFSCLKCFKTQRRKRGHGNLLFQSYFLRLLRKSSVHHFNNLSKKCKFFLKFVNFSLKKCQKKVLYLQLRENDISQPVGDIYQGKVNQPVTSLEWTNTMPQEAPLKKSTMANIPHVNCDCTEHWLQLTIRHSNELGVSLKGSKSSDRGKIIHQVCTESHSNKARQGMNHSARMHDLSTNASDAVRPHTYKNIHRKPFTIKMTASCLSN